MTQLNINMALGLDHSCHQPCAASENRIRCNADIQQAQLCIGHTPRSESLEYMARLYITIHKTSMMQLYISIALSLPLKGDQLRAAKRKHIRCRPNIPQA